MTELGTKFTTMTLPMPGEVFDIAVSETASTILVLLEHQLVFIRRQTGAGRYHVDQIPLRVNADTDRMCESVLCDPASSKAYVFSADNIVFIIDVAKKSVLGSFGINVNFRQVAISLDGQKIYGTSDKINVLSTAKQSIIKQLGDSKYGYSGVSVSPDGKRAYACGIGSPGNPLSGGHAACIDVGTDEIIRTKTGLFDDSKLAVSSDSRKVYLAGADEAGNDLVGVNLWEPVTNAVTVPFSIGSGMDAMAASPVSPHIFIAAENGVLYVIDSLSDKIVGTHAIGSSIPSLVVDAFDRLYRAGGRTVEIMIWTA